MPAKKNERDQAALTKLFEQRSYIGGRLPDILEPAPPIEELAPPVWEVKPVDEASPETDEHIRPKRKARSEKATGLHIILTQIQRDGFPHPLNQGSFLMLPKVFKALLSLEPVSVIQVVYEIFDQTIGWIDEHGQHGRKEWARLPLRHFELSCGMTSAQVKRGLKRALQNGYILRRNRLDSFEYGIRWATPQD
jgi:hypothetical protein